MTEWNPNNPFDLGVWDELGLTPPPMPDPKGECEIKLPLIPMMKTIIIIIPTIQEAPDFKTTVC